MDTLNKIEDMLAEIIEQGNEQKTAMNKLREKVDSLDTRLSRIEEAGANPQVIESVITLADHRKKIGEIRAIVNKWYEHYVENRKLLEKLKAEQPYWATKEWPIKAFRWIHDKRHLWIWVIYVLFTLIFSLFIYLTTMQHRQIIELQQTQMKYRFIKAMGVAPNAVQYLEDAYDECDRGKINRIENIVSGYEKVLKQKADSIAREERRKLERF